VNAIAPGPFPTKMMGYMLEGPEGAAAVISRVPLGRIGTPEDIAVAQRACGWGSDSDLLRVLFRDLRHLRTLVDQRGRRRNHQDEDGQRRG